MTFKERFLRNDCNMDTIDDWVAFWHDGAKDGQGLQEFLGLADKEYGAWLREGLEGLAKAIQKDARTQYKTVYLTWNELSEQLQDLARQRMGMECSIFLGRLDYYYWRMKIEFPFPVDAALSAKICERLELQGVEPDHFVEDDVVEEEHLLRLLEQLTGYEVSSSHADDDGVWIICKEYRASSQEYADRLISNCEKRLRMEIRNRHYPLVNPDTACHQLFGFKEALKMLGILPEGKCSVRPDHFANIKPRLTQSEESDVSANLPSAETVQKALQCLSDNGIEADETETVLQALGYILFDAEIL